MALISAVAVPATAATRTGGLRLPQSADHTLALNAVWGVLRLLAKANGFFGEPLFVEAEGPLA
jgi:hypothetical protein